MNLEDLSLEELKSLQNDVAVALYNFEKRKKAVSDVSAYGSKWR